jgi:magnesium-transporting ATPase (P-type)
MRIHQLSALDAVASLKSTAAGLSRAEVERRLHEYGRNEVEKVARGPLWLRFIREFTTFFVMQIVNVFLCRSATRSVFSTGLRGNTLIILGVISEIAILLLINYTPWGNSLLGTAPIGAEVWGFVIPFAAGMFILEELRKWLARTTNRGRLG